MGEGRGTEKYEGRREINNTARFLQRGPTPDASLSIGWSMFVSSDGVDGGWDGYRRGDADARVDQRVLRWGPVW
jgi:hypothetical protein